MPSISKLRVEFLSIGQARGRLGGQVALPDAIPLGSVWVDLLVGAAASPLAVPATVPASPGEVFAEVSASGAPAYVAVGANPDPTAEPRLLVAPGRPRLLHLPAGAGIAALLAGDVSECEAAGGAVEAASPTLTAGNRGPLSLNTRGALRVIRQRADGTDVDETAARETLPARSGTVTVAQAAVTNAAPSSPALPANAARKHVRLSYKAGGANVYWAPTAALATTGAGCLVPPGTTSDLLPGYTGDVFLVADAAGPTAVSIAQLA